MLVEVQNLVKKFGSFAAVDDISFTIEEGEILGFLGLNGAGKTTTIHLLVDLITPTSGTIKIFGKNLHSSRSDILQDVNFASPYVSLPYRMTVVENLRVFAALYAVPDPRARIKELLTLFHAEELAHKPIAALSSGEGTRIGLCKALLNRPRLLLLDEATASLDPHMAHETRQILLNIQRDEGVTMLYTSHNMPEIERLCNRVIFLHHGRIVAAGSPVEITRIILQEERHEPSLEEVFLRISTTPAV